MIAATAFAAIAAPIAGASPALSMTARVSGSVVATWHGDPARGCAAAGLCNSLGSATYRPGFDGRLTVAGDNVSFAGADTGEPPVVRVRDWATPAPVACADVLESIFSPLSFDYLGDELQVSLEALDLSAGRCAGPRTLDLAHAFPRGTIKTSELRRAGGTVDLSARTRFAAGPFSGEVISTVRVRLGRVQIRRGGIGPGVLQLPGSRGKPGRFWVLDLQYRIAGVSGALVTDFRGIADPACGALGACEASGSSSYALGGVSGRIDVLAGAPLRSGHRPPSVRVALRRLRRGSLAAYSQNRLWQANATVRESFSSPGSNCSDSLYTEPPTVDSRSTSKGLVLLLDSNDLSPVADTLRTRCPGPSQADVLGAASLAHGSVDFAELGSKTLQVTAVTSRTFTSGAYTGSRRGQLQLDLGLLWKRVRVVRG